LVAGAGFVLEPKCIFRNLECFLPGRERGVRIEVGWFVQHVFVINFVVRHPEDAGHAQPVFPAGITKPLPRKAGLKF
jgi:hypothetical protein